MAKKNTGGAGKGNVTTDHETIKKWAEERGGTPSVVKDTEDEEEDGGILRIDFGEKEETLEPVSWDEFFKTFEDKNLAFLYQDQMVDGSMSRFFKFIDRDSVDVEEAADLEEDAEDEGVLDEEDEDEDDEDLEDTEEDDEE